jgi:hypothetical protein
VVSVNSSKNEDHQHFWLGCDDLVFIAGKNAGSSADVFCRLCDMGAFTDEQGVIPHSIAKVGLKD